MHDTYARAVGRRTEFLLRNFRAIQSDDHMEEVLNNGKKKLILRFLMTPKQILVNESDAVSGVTFGRNDLTGSANE